MSESNEEVLSVVLAPMSENPCWHAHDLSWLITAIIKHELSHYRLVQEESVNLLTSYLSELCFDDVIFGQVDCVIFSLNVSLS